MCFFIDSLFLIENNESGLNRVHGCRKVKEKGEKKDYEKKQHDEDSGRYDGGNDGINSLPGFS